MSSSTVRVLVAPDKFKGSATAAAVADAVGAGLVDAAPGAVVVRRPIADGGDGTVDVLLASGYEPLSVTAADASGRPRDTVVAVRAGCAVVELASTCGLAGLGGGFEPLRSSTLGLGLALRAVLDAGYRDVVLALGGSASTDGGLGLVTALGGCGLDARGEPVSPDGHGLTDLDDLDLSGLRLPEGLRLRLACDVRSPMHGDRGAARVFGPQKGATAEQVAALDAGLRRLAAVLAERCGVDPGPVAGAGAAGGTGGMAVAALGATVVDGAGLVLDAIGFGAELARADLVVTGEGAWDAQSLLGKGPGAVLRLARRAGVPVVVVAGQVAPGAGEAPGVVLAWSLAEALGSVEEALREPLPALRAAGTAIGLRLGQLAAHGGRAASSPRTPTS